MASAPEFDEIEDEAPIVDDLQAKFAPKAAPKNANGSGPKTASGRKPTKTALQGQLEKLYTGVGTIVFTVDPICGQAIVENAENTAMALDNLAKNNPKVKALLEKLLAQSAFGMVLAAHTPIIMAIATHHVPFVRDRMATLIAAQEGME